MYKKWANQLKIEIENKFCKESVLEKMKTALSITNDKEVDQEIESMFASLSD